MALNILPKEQSIALMSSTGAITVQAWDSGSTFPTSGYTVGATVFKWQREYFDISDMYELVNEMQLPILSFQAIEWLTRSHHLAGRS